MSVHYTRTLRTYADWFIFAICQHKCESECVWERDMESLANPISASIGNGLWWQPTPSVTTLLLPFLYLTFRYPNFSNILPSGQRREIYFDVYMSFLIKLNEKLFLSVKKVAPKEIKINDVFDDNLFGQMVVNVRN